MTQANREAWEAASCKHVREYDDLLALAASGAALNASDLADRFPVGSRTAF